MDRKGFTLIELLIVIAIMAMIGGASVVLLSQSGLNQDLVATTHSIATLLRQAQSNSVAQQQEAAWGVYFSNVTNTAPFYALFTGSYTNQSAQNRLPSTLGYLTSFLPVGATTSITFAQISGMASASMTVGLYVLAQPSLSSTITIASSGEVSD